MSVEFKEIGDCCLSGVHKASDGFIRAKSVEAALVLINSRISACDGVHAMKEALNPETIATLVNNIEAALKNTK